MRCVHVALVAAVAVVSVVHGEQPRPNVIIIFCDDLGYADVGCYGADDIPTPNIDRMASQGVRFTDFYATASYCTPSRTGLMTGCYPQRVGMINNVRPGRDWGLNPNETTHVQYARNMLGDSPGNQGAALWPRGELP